MQKGNAGQDQQWVSITAEQECLFIDHLIHMARIGYGISKRDIPLLIKEILDKAMTDRGPGAVQL